MFDDVEPLDSTAVLHGQALEAKTDSEHGNKEVFRDMPDILDYPNVSRIVRRARARSNNDGVEVLEQRDEGGGRQRIVFDDVNVASRYGLFTKRG